MIDLFFASQVYTWIDSLQLFGTQVISLPDVVSLLARFAFNTFVLYLMIQHLYARNSKRKDYYFSYFAVGITVFMLCYLLETVKLELGFALGLFAIFGIIRYRTDAIPTKEMTYLFVIIGISVMNSLATNKVSHAELVLTNLIIIVLLYMLEKLLKLKQEDSLNILYEKIENINICNRKELVEDLTARTGINIKRYDIVKVDFMRDVAEITVYFDANEK